MPQTINDIVERLDKAGLISPYEKKEFKKERKEQEEHWAKLDSTGRTYNLEQEIISDPYFPLTILLRLKMHTTAGVLSIMFTPTPVHVKKGNEKKLTGQLEKFANKLRKAELISDKTFSELLPHIHNIDLRSEYEVTAFAGERTEKEYFLTRGRLDKFVDQLLAKDLISEIDHKEIMQKSNDSAFRNYDEVLRYLKNFVIIHTNDYSGTSKDYLEKVYRKTATIFEGLDFDSFNFSIVPDKRESFRDFRVFNINVTLKVSGTTYRYKSYFDAEYKNKKEDNELKLPDRYHEIFNKILADKGSPYRLHLVGLSRDHFGIIAMTSAQFKDLQWSYSGMTQGYINVSYENFTNKLTQSKIKNTINTYDSLGLLSHMSPGEIDSCVKEIESKEINYYSDILSSFKDLVFEIDLEYGVNDGQYKEVTEKISAISKGRFSPKDIVDTYNFEKRKKFEFGFTLNGKKYLSNLYQEDDWLDLGFWELIEKAMNEQVNDGKFYYVHPADGMRQIYLTNMQVEFLKKNKLIELSESDLEE